MVESNVKLVYEDDQIVVLEGVNMRLIAGVSISPQHGARNLTNSVQFKAKSKTSHFIQFVTRVVPDLFSLKKNEKLGSDQLVLWDQVDDHYMGDLKNPKFRLDVGEDSESCFYDDVGVSLLNDAEGVLSIFDCPGGSFEPDEERSIFCTFVFIEGKITHVIKWSKENVLIDNVLQENYSFKIESWGYSLPSWAMKLLDQFFKDRKIEFPRL